MTGLPTCLPGSLAQSARPVACGGNLQCARLSGTRRPCLSRRFIRLNVAAAASANDVTWKAATVIANSSVSADEGTRELRLSVSDPSPSIEGRNFGLKRSSGRWVDAYTCPGQYVGVKASGQDSDELLLAIASTPYASRQASAHLDATLIDVLVGAEGLGALEPGSELEVSEPRGPGFASVLGLSTLKSCLGTCQNVVMIAMGPAGMAAMHAAVEWAPVQAHATKHSVSLLYVAQDLQAAAYLKDWDSWRGAGLAVSPIYLCDNEDEDGLEADDHLIRRLAAELFSQKPVFGSQPEQCAVLMAGLPPKVTAALCRQLSEMGIPGERLLTAAPPQSL